MISLLTIEGGMGITEPGETLERKLAVRALGFLEADHIGPCEFDKFCHEVDAQAHRIDVPCGDLQFHLCTSATLWSSCSRHAKGYRTSVEQVLLDRHTLRGASYLSSLPSSVRAVVTAAQ